jgi:hypothetical protein
MRLFENGVLRTRERKKQETGENYVMGSFIICTPHIMLLG